MKDGVVVEDNQQTFIADFKQCISAESCHLPSCLPCNLCQRDLNLEKISHLHSLQVASVLVGIQFDPNSKSWRYLLTLRNADMRRNGGETCFPGGMVERTDNSVVDAALREAEEEIGLKRHDCQVLGVLPPHLSMLGVLVHQVVAVIKSDFIPTPNQHEVADVFYVDIKRVCTGDNHAQLRMVFYGDNIGANYYHYEYNGHMYTVYGLTATILAFLYHITDGPDTNCPHCAVTRRLLCKHGGMCQLLHKFLNNFNMDGRLWSFKLLREASISEMSKVMEDSKPKPQTVSRL